MTPVPSTSRSLQRRALRVAAPLPAVPLAPRADDPRGPHDVPRPIGKARLRALREAIRRGTYPTEADVAGGLARMLEVSAQDGRRP
jgi:hypothetical protein